MKHIKTDSIEVKKIRRYYYKQSNANKTGSLEEMNKFMEIYNPLRINNEKQKIQISQSLVKEIA